MSRRESRILYHREIAGIATSRIYGGDKHVKGRQSGLLVGFIDLIVAVISAFR